MNEIIKNQLFMRDESTGAYYPVQISLDEVSGVSEVVANQLYVRDGQTNALVPVVKVLGGGILATNVGEIKIFAKPLSAEQAAAARLLLCDGSVLNPVENPEYSALCEFLGDTYGAANKLPDMAGMFIRGAGGNAAAVGTKQADGLKSHTHTFTNCSTGGNNGLVVYVSGSAGIGTLANTSATGIAQETRPVNYTMYHYIKY